MADAVEEVGEQHKQPGSSEGARDAQADGRAAPTEKGPTQPATPAQPAQPATPAQPAQPATPAQPTQPAQPHAHPAATPAQPAQPAQPTQPATPAQPAQPTEPAQPAAQDGRWVSALNQFKLKRFFVLRPGTLNQAIEDIHLLVDKEIDGAIHSTWLMAEVDHWNNEKERIVLITDNSLLVCKYDFVMFSCEQIQRIPLNFVDRISHGTFSFPKHSLLAREGEGLRIFWDRQREPSFTSRWNPFTVDYPFISFMYHPVRNASDKFAALCEIQSFREQLKAAAERAHATKPVPGKANGVLLLSQPLLVEAYVGLMSFIGNQNKLGYCMARGNIGF